MTNIEFRSLDGGRKHDGKDFEEVAILHQSSITEGFLSSLNPRVLQCVYQSIADTPGGKVIVAKIGGETVGFISAAASLRLVMKYMIAKRCGKLVFGLLPELGSLSRFKRLLELVSYSLKSKRVKLNEPLPEIELLSLCVGSDYRRRGIARSLCVELWKSLESLGHKEFYIVVGEKLEGARQFYTSMGARDVGKIVLHSGETSRVFKQDREII